MSAPPGAVRMGQVEIRIVLDRVEPLAGRVQVIAATGRAAGTERGGDELPEAGGTERAERTSRDWAQHTQRDSNEDTEHIAGQGGQIQFVGWLGLLRALYEITAASEAVQPPEP